MKVLHVSSYCGHGGVETVLGALISEQRKAGLDVEVFYFVNLGGAGHYENICPVRFANQQPLTQLIVNGKYDLIHVVADAAHSAEKCLKRSLYKGPVVVTCHGSFTGNLNSNFVTAVSGYVANRIQEQCPRPMHVVHNGVDTSVFYPPSHKQEGKPIIAWVGRSNDSFKDIGGLIALASSGIASDFKFIVVDGVHTDDNIRNWLPPDAEVIKRKPWNEMPDFYRSVAASEGFLLSTSRLEACPMNILEAQACGCPVIAPGVGGIPEIVEHEQTGFLYDREAGLSALNNAISWLYRADNYGKVSEAAAQYVMQNFTASEMSSKYMDIYKSAIKTRRKSISNKIVQSALRLSMRLVKPSTTNKKRRVRKLQ